MVVVYNVWCMCEHLGESEPVSEESDTEDITPASLDAVPPSVGQMPQGKRHGRLGRLAHIAFSHIPALNMCTL